MLIQDPGVPGWFSTDYKATIKDFRQEPSIVRIPPVIPTALFSLPIGY